MGVLVLFPLDAQKKAVDHHQDRHEALEIDVLNDVVDEGLHLGVLRLGRDMQGLRDLQPLLQVAPSHLVNCGKKTEAVSLTPFSSVCFFSKQSVILNQIKQNISALVYLQCQSRELPDPLKKCFTLRDQDEVANGWKEGE